MTTYQQVVSYRAMVQRGWAKYRTMANGTARTNLLHAIRAQERTLQSMWADYLRTRGSSSGGGAGGPGTPGYTPPGMTPDPTATPGAVPPDDWYKSYQDKQAAERKKVQLEDAKATLQSTLSRYGLSQLADWAWSELTSGKPMEQILLELRDQPAFKSRFPGMDARKKAGFNALSVDEYLNIEDAYRHELLSHGQQIPTDPSGFIPWFAQDITPNEVKERLDDWDKATKVYGPHVKQVWAKYLGTSNLSDADVYGLISGLRPDLAHQYAAATGTKAMTQFDILNAFRQAEGEERAEFSSGGNIISRTPAQFEKATSNREAAYS